VEPAASNAARVRSVVAVVAAEELGRAVDDLAHGARSATSSSSASSTTRVSTFRARPPGRAGLAQLVSA